MTDGASSRLRPYHRMPTEFGPAPGPRNVPADLDLPAGPERRTTVAFTTSVHAADVEPFLPPGLPLRLPLMTVRVQRMSNLRWLAGRGYDIVSVSFPVARPDATGPQDAEFLAVLWENRAEPIITGREELGFPKLYAEIESSGVDPAVDSFAARASWDGVAFFTAAANGLAAVSPPQDGPPLTITHRYLPAIGRLDTADADCLTISVPSALPANAIVHAAIGEGELTFHPVSWHDNPVQQPVISALAGIRQKGTVAVRVSCEEGDVTSAENRRLEGA